MGAVCISQPDVFQDYPEPRTQSPGPGALPVVTPLLCPPGPRHPSPRGSPAILSVSQDRALCRFLTSSRGCCCSGRWAPGGGALWGEGAPLQTVHVPNPWWGTLSTEDVRFTSCCLSCRDGSGWVSLSAGTGFGSGCSRSGMRNLSWETRPGPCVSLLLASLCPRPRWHRLVQVGLCSTS